MQVPVRKVNGLARRHESQCHGFQPQCQKKIFLFKAGSSLNSPFLISPSMLWLMLRYSRCLVPVRSSLKNNEISGLLDHMTQPVYKTRPRSNRSHNCLDSVRERKMYWVHLPIHQCRLNWSSSLHLHFLQFEEHIALKISAIIKDMYNFTNETADSITLTLLRLISFESDGRYEPYL